MNKEETDNSVMDTVESGNIEEFKGGSDALIKNEISSGIGIENVADKESKKPDEKNIKIEEPTEAVKQVETENKYTIDKQEDKSLTGNDVSPKSDPNNLVQVLEKPNQIPKLEIHETIVEKLEAIPDEKEETETIHLIEETIIIPASSEGSEKSLNQETIEYNVIEYTDSPPKSPIFTTEECPEMHQNGSSASLDQSKTDENSKARSLIEDIYDDWSDGNVEDEEMASLKVDDTVENQLETLLDEKSSKSPRLKLKSPSPKQFPQSQNLAKTRLDQPESTSLKQEESKILTHIDETSAASKELLAILEGDAEPDWSDLKPPTLTVESNSDSNLKEIEHNSPPKLDPLVERQLALQQLLALPLTAKKPRISPRKSPVVPKQIFDEDESIEQVKIDETRSGRKRKPTEKAREHEITAKRQKIIKKSPKKSEAISPSEKTEESIDSKLQSPAVPKKIMRKSPAKVSNSLKSKKLAKSISETPKPRKKVVNEIDRLLQDEGVVNLLYDVEQPGKRRLVPVTKSQAKVMDIQKVQRELKIRTKLVKNAVLRLRTSAAPGAKAPRAKRMSAGSISLDDQSPTSKSEFLYPAKIRNAADASIIVRRHSSSSFSSASGSPRVSIDSTDRGMIFDDVRGLAYPVKPNKRNYQDKKKIDGKKSKKLINDDQSIAFSGQKPKGKGKRIVKSKDLSDEDIYDKKDGTLRSNGAGKLLKTKKIQKNKVTFAKNSDDHDDDIIADVNKDSQVDDEEDELSACLAEAVTALANDSSARDKNSVLNRKGKYSREQRSNVNQFSNKEISVQKHGNLVQLILTPSTTSKIRNGITLEMMQEFRQVLSILKKDDDCRVVLLTSTGSSFCEGLELSTLLEENKDVRRANAQLLANGVKDFIKSLATFNKPIVAGVQGSAVGLGVTMLPLFDLVIASDKASFSTPYGKLGQIAEGAAVFTLSHVLGSAVVIFLHSFIDNNNSVQQKLIILRHKEGT